MNMPGHRFKLHQQVVLLHERFSARPSGTYEVTRLLPESDGEFLYRVKNARESHERVVKESDIAKLG